jgi:hypothetical protein
MIKGDRIALLFLSATLGVVAANGQAGGIFAVKQGFTSSGGGVANDAVNSVFTVNGTIAEPIAGTRSNGGIFGVWSGFWPEATSVRTASGVSISGRVTAAGRGLRGATVTITDRSGLTRSVVTGPTGSYRIDDVTTGQVYVIAVVSRRFSFTEQIVSVTDSLTNVDLVSP